MSSSNGVDDRDDAAALLESCTESGRLTRASKLIDDVDFLVADGELVIAAVANYNVVIDVAARRIQHGCRDFRGEAPARRLCKHIAATVLALEPELARSIAAELAAGDAGAAPSWGFEVITRFTPR